MTPVLFTLTVLAAVTAVRAGFTPVSANAGIAITGGGCSGGGTGFCFSPEAVTVPAGTTVTWTDHSGLAHTATSCDPNQCPGVPANTGSNTFSVNIAMNSANSFTFTSPGTYTYYCAVHGYSMMHGAITVGAASTPTPTPAPTPPPTPAPTPTPAAQSSGSPPTPAATSGPSGSVTPAGSSGAVAVAPSGTPSESATPAASPTASLHSGVLGTSTGSGGGFPAVAILIVAGLVAVLGPAGYWAVRIRRAVR